MSQVLLVGRYKAVGLCKDGVQRLIKVHVMVAEAFLGPRPPGAVMRHLDGDNLNNYYRNLKWGSHAENSADRIRHGRSGRGDAHPTAKLRSREVLRIRELSARGEKNSVLARKFKVSNQIISAIKLRKVWKHLP